MSNPWGRYPGMPAFELKPDPATGYGPPREQPDLSSRGWSETIDNQTPAVDGQMIPLLAPRRVMQHTSNAQGILQLQFIGQESPPLSPALEIEITQGVDTGRVIWRVYVGRVGVAVPVPAGLIYADAVRTRGPGGLLAAQLRQGSPSFMNLTFYERIPAATQLPIPLPLGTNRWEVEVGPGVTVSVSTGKSLVAVGPGPATGSGIVTNDAIFNVTNAGGVAVDCLVRFTGNA